jgi:chromate transporter
MGYQIAGVPGALAAALGFFLPSGAIGLTLILLWNRIRESRRPKAIREAITPVAVGLVLASVFTIGRSALTDVAGVAIAGTSTLLFWRAPVPTPVVILAAGVLGAVAFAR